MSLFDDGDAALLKKWVVSRLENISDADSDVLADYVLALLRHEQSESEVRQMCVDQLDDFLRDHTSTFVNELFAALRSKSYLSVNSTLHGGLISTSPPPSTTAPTAQSTNDDADSEASYAPKSPDMSSPAQFATQSSSSTHNSPVNSRKRGYYDRDAPGAQNQAGQYSSNSRTKTPKTQARGGGRGNHASEPSNRWARRGGGDFGRNGAAGMQNGHPSQPLMQGGFPLGMVPGGLPIVAPTLPFPTDPMSQLVFAQAAAAVQSGWNPLAMFHPPPELLAQTENRQKRGICHSYEQKGYCRRGDSCPYLHANPLVVPPVKGQDEDEYDPHTPMLSPQELERRPSITFPVKPPPPTRGGGTQRGGRGGSNRGGRSELSGFGPPREMSKALVVECIPDDKLDEQSIHGYFTTFGPIESVEMRPESKLAILTFENHGDAKKAYNSPEPIFNNRFVKVYWLKSDSDGPQSYQQPGDSQHQPDEMEIDMEDFQRKQTEAQKAYDEKQAKKKKIDDEHKQLDELRADLARRQEEEKKKLLARLSKKHASNGASSNLETNEKEAKTAQQTAALKAQLEALEAEATSLGIDHSKLDEPLPDFHPSSYNRGRGSLRARGGFSGFSARGAYVPRGRGGSAFTAYRGRGRGAPMAKKMTLDNRTKTVMVNGVSDSDIETLQQFMLACGSQYTKLEKNQDTEDSHLITFNTRGDAARFYHADPNVPHIGKIEVSWVESGKTANGIHADSTDSQNDVDIDFTDGNTENGNGNGMATNELDQFDVYDMADDDDSRWT
ncbi:hypothetical protein ABW21_db0200485 [Orbilia brochopaga]|nr:hypothetical protein ABW21_db0200485 [Drechslerella brochopaga]